MGELPRLEPSHLAERAHSELRAAILGRRLSPGSRLVEADLAHQLGVSRPPVREALIALESEGLTVRVRGRGTFVQSLSAADVREVYTLRTALESLAFRLAREHLTKAKIDALRRLITDMERAAAIEDVQKLVLLDVSFHESIVRLADHRRAFAAWTSMNVQIQLLSRRVIHTLYDDLAVVPQNHQRLLDALVNDDDPRAVEEHILSVADRILPQLSVDRTESLGTGGS